MRLLAKSGHPYYTERTMTIGKELARAEVFHGATGPYIGTIVYVGRKMKKGGTEYGWRTEKSAPQSKLMDQFTAIMKLPNA